MGLIVERASCGRSIGPDDACRKRKDDGSATIVASDQLVKDGNPRTSDVARERHCAPRDGEGSDHDICEAPSAIADVNADAQTEK